MLSDAASRFVAWRVRGHGVEYAGRTDGLLQAVGSDVRRDLALVEIQSSSR